jgi:hypothetical protein
MTLHGDADFYVPLSYASRKGQEYVPAGVPESWSVKHDGPWTHWLPEYGLGGVEQGWKIHVSCKIDRAQHVLDTAAAVFFAYGVAFKHLACGKFFCIVHDKQAPRQQSGKFCAAYPPDEDSALAIMKELAEALAGEEGPSVLTDRPFGDSKVVHYRYGAYTKRSRIELDGTREMLVRDGDGQLVPDVRGMRFSMPAGITDPFGGPVETATAPGQNPVLAGYSFESALRHNNAGGAYKARRAPGGEAVFVKAGRSHNGLAGPDSTSVDRLRGEHRTLQALHAARPGICPEPLDYFPYWENEFLVTEFVAGDTLNQWSAEHNPVYWATAEPRDFHDYYRRCQAITRELSGILASLHEAGWVFGDLSPANVLIGEDDSVRLVDFEGALPASEYTGFLGTPGFSPRPDQAAGNPLFYDEYGLSSLALTMIAPLNITADRNPAVLAHLRHQLDPLGPIPDALWDLAARFRQPATGSACATPTPAELDADPKGQLAALRDQLVSGLLEHASRDGMVPLGPRSHVANSLCAANGLAGVVHALAGAGAAEPQLLEKLRRESVRDAGELPPGLDTGLAGIARVLADAGLAEEAATLLARADAHPLLAGSATLAEGKAGVALAHLALYGHTGDEFHVDRAASLSDAIPRDASLDSQLDSRYKEGLSFGRAGIALLDLYLARITGQDRWLAVGLRLLEEELHRALSGRDGLRFAGPRSQGVPYLSYGSAGVGMVVSRYLDATGSEQMAMAMPGLLAGAGTLFSPNGGLYAGLAGIGLFLDDHARHHNDGLAAAQAQQAAKRMFLYAIPRHDGTWVMGEGGLRMSGDLAFGTAGIITFLTQHLNSRTDSMFTLDQLLERPCGDEG